MIILEYDDKEIEVSGQRNYAEVLKLCRRAAAENGVLTITGPDGDDLSDISGSRDPYELCVLGEYFDDVDGRAKIAFMSQQGSFESIKHFDRAFFGEFEDLEDFGLCMARDHGLEDFLEPYFDGLKFALSLAESDYKVVASNGESPSPDSRDKVYVFNLNNVADQPGVRM